MTLRGRRRSRPLCYVHRGKDQDRAVVETCTRTIHGLPLLRPGPGTNELIVGALGRAAEYYDVPLYGFATAGNHYHCLSGPQNGLQLSRFQCHLNSNIAREVGRRHGHREKFWARRYRALNISDEKKSQRDRLKYVLANGTKEGLVESPLDWPGPNLARALVHGEPMVGYWYNRTKEYKARRKGVDFDPYDFATRYEIHFQQLPAYADDSPEAYRQMVADLIGEIEEEAADKRKGRRVLGVERILAQDPCQPIGTPKKSPAPPLFKADTSDERRAMENKYKDFVDKYDVASGKMLEAAIEGYRLDPRRLFPDGSFPPALVEEILRSASSFNPALEFPCGGEFPGGSFPRPWPFVGGGLPPAPSDPPTRRLVIEEIDGKDTIVWREEGIPTVEVAAPSRASARSRPRLLRRRRLRSPPRAA